MLPLRDCGGGVVIAVLRGGGRTVQFAFNYFLEHSVRPSSGGGLVSLFVRRWT